jgi:hypothetical protein
LRIAGTAERADDHSGFFPEIIHPSRRGTTMKLSARYLLAALVLAAAACAAPTGPDTSAATADASLDGGTAPSDTTANRGPNLFGSGN